MSAPGASAAAVAAGSASPSKPPTSRVVFHASSANASFSAAAPFSAAPSTSAPPPPQQPQPRATNISTSAPTTAAASSFSATAISAAFSASLAKMPSEAAQLAFWQKYLDSTDAQQDALAASPAFIAHVWGGVPEPLRARVWQQVRGVPPTQYTVDDARLPASFIADLDAEIMCAQACPALPEPIADQEQELVRTVLKIDAGVFARTAPPPGSVQLLQRISPVTKTVSATLYVHQALAHRMARLRPTPARPATAGANAAGSATGSAAGVAGNAAGAGAGASSAGAGAAGGGSQPSGGNVASRNSNNSSSSSSSASSSCFGSATGSAKDSAATSAAISASSASSAVRQAGGIPECALALADAVATWDPALAARMQRAGLDAHDLHTLTREWALPLFASAYPAPVVLRALDIALLDPRGPHAVSLLLYGLLKLVEATSPAVAAASLSSSPAAAKVVAGADGGAGNNPEAESKTDSASAASAAAAAAAAASAAGAGAGLVSGASFPGDGSAAASPEATRSASSASNANSVSEPSLLSHALVLPSRLLALSASDAAAAATAAVAVTFATLRSRDREWWAMLLRKDWTTTLARSGPALLTVVPGVGSAVAAPAETPAQREARLVGQIAYLQRLIVAFMRARRAAAEEKARALAQAEAEAESRKAMRRLVALAAEHTPAARDLVETMERLGAQLAEIEREVFNNAHHNTSHSSSSSSSSSSSTASSASSTSGSGVLGVSAALSDAFAATRALFDRLQTSLGSALVADTPVNGAGLFAKFDITPAGAGADAGGLNPDGTPNTAGAGTGANELAGSFGLGLGGGRPVFLKSPPPTGLIKFGELASYLELPCAHMEGYLRKARMPKPGQDITVVARRYFVLYGPFLTHFKTHSDRTPSKNIAVDLRGRTIAMIDRHPLGEFGIEVCTRKQTTLYLLFADSEMERRKWVMTIAAVARLPPG